MNYYSPTIPTIFPPYYTHTAQHILPCTPHCLLGHTDRDPELQYTCHRTLCAGGDWNGRGCGERTGSCVNGGSMATRSAPPHQGLPSGVSSTCLWTTSPRTIPGPSSRSAMATPPPSPAFALLLWLRTPWWSPSARPSSTDLCIKQKTRQQKGNLTV